MCTQPPCWFVLDVGKLVLLSQSHGRSAITLRSALTLRMSLKPGPLRLGLGCLRLWGHALTWLWDLWAPLLSAEIDCSFSATKPALYVDFVGQVQKLPQLSGFEASTPLASLMMVSEATVARPIEAGVVAHTMLQKSWLPGKMRVGSQRVVDMALIRAFRSLSALRSEGGSPATQPHCLACRPGFVKATHLRHNWRRPRPLLPSLNQRSYQLCQSLWAEISREAWVAVWKPLVLRAKSLRAVQQCTLSNCSMILTSRVRFFSITLMPKGWVHAAVLQPVELLKELWVSRVERLGCKTKRLTAGGQTHHGIETFPRCRSLASVSVACSSSALVPGWLRSLSAAWGVEPKATAATNLQGQAVPCCKTLWAELVAATCTAPLTFASMARHHFQPVASLASQMMQRKVMRSSVGLSFKVVSAGMSRGWVRANVLEPLEFHCELWASRISRLRWTRAKMPLLSPSLRPGSPKASLFELPVCSSSAEAEVPLRRHQLVEQDVSLGAAGLVVREPCRFCRKLKALASPVVLCSRVAGLRDVIPVSPPPERPRQTCLQRSLPLQYHTVLVVHAFGFFHEVYSQCSGGTGLVFEQGVKTYRIAHSAVRAELQLFGRASVLWGGALGKLREVGVPPAQAMRALCSKSHGSAFFWTFQLCDAWTEATLSHLCAWVSSPSLLWLWHQAVASSKALRCRLRPVKLVFLLRSVFPGFELEVGFRQVWAMKWGLISALAAASFTVSTSLRLPRVLCPVFPCLSSGHSGVVRRLPVRPRQGGSFVGRAMAPQVDVALLTAGFVRPLLVPSPRRQQELAQGGLLKTRAKKSCQALLPLTSAMAGLDKRQSKGHVPTQLLLHFVPPGLKVNVISLLQLRRSEQTSDGKKFSLPACPISRAFGQMPSTTPTCLSPVCRIQPRQQQAPIQVTSHQRQLAQPPDHDMDLHRVIYQPSWQRPTAATFVQASFVDVVPPVPFGSGGLLIFHRARPRPASQQAGVKKVKLNGLLHPVSMVRARYSAGLQGFGTWNVQLYKAFAGCREASDAIALHVLDLAPRLGPSMHRWPTQQLAISPWPKLTLQPMSRAGCLSCVRTIGQQWKSRLVNVRMGRTPLSASSAHHQELGMGLCCLCVVGRMLKLLLEARSVPASTPAKAPLIASPMAFLKCLFFWAMSFERRAPEEAVAASVLLRPVRPLALNCQPRGPLWFVLGVAEIVSLFRSLSRWTLRAKAAAAPPDCRSMLPDRQLKACLRQSELPAMDGCRLGGVSKRALCSSLLSCPCWLQQWQGVLRAGLYAPCCTTAWSSCCQAHLLCIVLQSLELDGSLWSAPTALLVLPSGAGRRDMRFRRVPGLWGGASGKLRAFGAPITKPMRFLCPSELFQHALSWTFQLRAPWAEATVSHLRAWISSPLHLQQLACTACLSARSESEISIVALTTQGMVPTTPLSASSAHHQQLGMGLCCLCVVGGMLKLLLEARSVPASIPAATNVPVPPACSLEASTATQFRLASLLPGRLCQTRPRRKSALLVAPPPWLQTKRGRASAVGQQMRVPVVASCEATMSSMSMVFFEGAARIGSQRAQGISQFFDLLSLAACAYVAPLEAVLKTGGYMCLLCQVFHASACGGVVLAGHSLGASAAFYLTELLLACGIEVSNVVGLDLRGVPRLLPELGSEQRAGSKSRSLPMSLMQPLARHMHGNALQLNFQVAVAPFLSAPQRDFALSCELARNGLSGQIALNDADHFTLRDGFAWDISMRINVMIRCKRPESRPERQRSASAEKTLRTSAGSEKKIQQFCFLTS